MWQTDSLSPIPFVTCFISLIIRHLNFKLSISLFTKRKRCCCCLFSFLPIAQGNWNDGKFEDEGHLITCTYSYSGKFNGEQPLGPGRFHFDTGCEQVGEYVTKRIVLRTKTSTDVVHVPVWKCLALYEAGLRNLR